ncbi:hypothetical protein SGRIM128S_09674 [Streptomyces griseomycini]
MRATTGATASRSLVRTRVASSDWWASRKVVSVTPRVGEARSQRAKPSGPSSASRCREPAGGSPAGSGGSLVSGSTSSGRSPCGLFTVTSAR